MPYGEGERTGAESDERSRGSDGEKRRSGEGKEALGEAPEGNSEAGSPGTLGQEGGFLYFIENASGGVVKIGFSSSNPRRPAFEASPPRIKDRDHALSSLFRERFAHLSARSNSGSWARLEAESTLAISLAGRDKKEG